jgi:hypothetical protein
MSEQEKYFAGLDPFIWWIGVVESRQDPLALGRCQVRFFGYNNDSLADNPTSMLLWAHPAHSLNDSTFATPKESDVVFGFFADSYSRQQPIMLGVIPGYYTNPNNKGAGYNDVRDDKTVSSAPRPVKSRQYNTDGTGIAITENTDASTLRYPRDYQVKNTSITSLATNQAGKIPNNSETVNVMIDRAKNLDTNVPTAAGISWNEPASPYQPKYPYNQVKETESGHVFEMDDTFGHERVSLMHRTGTFMEMYPDGSKVQKVTNANYEIVMGSDYVHIMGLSNKTVNGDLNVLIGGQCNVQISGNTTITVTNGDINMTAPQGNVTIAAGQTLALHGNQIDISAATSINKSAGSTVGVNAPGGMHMINGDITTGNNLSSDNGFSGTLTSVTGAQYHFVNGICVNKST